MIGRSGSGKTTTLLNITSHQPDIVKIHLYPKDSHNPKYQLLFKRREKMVEKIRPTLKHLYTQDIYENIEDYNPNRKRKIFIDFDDIIADMISSKKPNLVVTDLFIRGKKTKHFSRFLLCSHILSYQKMLS